MSFLDGHELARNLTHLEDSKVTAAIEPHSPFRRVPVDLPRRQILYFDALRISAEIADTAFNRLHRLLADISDKRHNEVNCDHNDLFSPQAQNAVPAMLDAYSFIDSVHRFREVLQITPGLRHNAPFELFMRRTSGVKELRNIVQHLNRHVDRIAHEGWAALGTLTWLGPSAVTNGPPSAYVLQAGTFYSNQLTNGPVLDISSSLQIGEIADISLLTAGLRVNLSTNINSLRSIIRSLEGPLEEFATGKERFGSDVLMAFALTPVTDEQIVPNGGSAAT
ncbi:MAG: hypothetical protein WD971_03075 [Pirellulales bacterium]